jgi:NADPH:quinone reductase-like Zn-dependent oxidoreductase
MRAYRLVRQEAGNRPKLTFSDLPDPGPGEVRIRVEAVSLNYRDLIVCSNPASEGRIPVSDGAGWIDSIGDGVDGWRTGDRVAVSFFRDWIAGPFKVQYLASAFGGVATEGLLSEYVVVPANSLVRVPECFNSIEAAALPCAAVTAWQALFVRSSLSQTDSVLIQGTGGVAIFSLQFASAVGARTIVLSSSDEKLDRAKMLGASEVINYRRAPDWDAQILEITEGEGVTRVLELGGPATYDKSLKVVAPGGKIAQIGVLTGFGPQPNLARLQSVNADILGITVGSTEHLRSMIAFMNERSIKPIVDHVFAFDAAPRAYDHLRSGNHFGKIGVSLL